MKGFGALGWLWLSGIVLTEGRLEEARSWQLVAPLLRAGEDGV